ncbi:cell division protein ZapA [Arenibaculum pallidiluteum]|uniref:cell division protein ZapA n=1 Tax=Arenibaculum pallidiluteum TaxID=2812559 RepID=UPI001A96644B|nr:cell division protein ZapA [Arenibaculum pallidiluteum]
MPRVDVTLNGRTYSVACEEGQENRVRELGRHVEGKLRQVLSRGAGGANEPQLLVLAALMVADELFDLRAELAAQTAALPREDAGVADAVDQLAQRIEAIAARLDRS